MPVSQRFQFKPLTPDLFADLEALFGPKGAADGCWCMYWRVRAKDWKAGTSAERQVQFKDRVGKGQPPGLLAFHDGQAVGWVQVTPRKDVPRYNNARTARPIEGEEGAWVITCFFIAKAWRKKGLMTELIEAACEFAKANGAHSVEASPIDPNRPLMWGEGFVGLAPAFRAAGFQEIERRTPTRPFMRRHV